MDQLRAIVSKENIDIIAITETWINSNSKHFLAEFHIPGYNLFKFDRVGRRGGGVAVYIRVSLKSCNKSNIKTNSDNESIWVEIGEGNESVVIGVIYRPPNLSRNDGKLLWEEIKKASDRNNVCILGDFNFSGIDWKNQLSDNESEDFLEVVQDSFLYQFINSPTRGNNILDLVLSNNENLVKDVGIGDELGNSDHKAIYFNIIWDGRKKENSALIPDFRNANYGSIRRDLRDDPMVKRLIPPTPPETVNLGRDNPEFNLAATYEQFIATINNAQNKHIPKRKFRSIRNQPKWMNNRLLDLLGKKKGVYRKVKKGENHLLGYYQNLTRQVKTEIRKAKRNYEIKVANESKYTPKAFYQLYKSKVRDTIGPLKTTTGEMTDDELEMCSTLNSHFRSVFTNENLAQFPEVHKVYNDSIENMLMNINITSNDVLKVINKLKPHKSPGPDEVYARILKECRDELSNPLAVLFNKSLESGLVPEAWKLANVVPIFKKGDKSIASNYRPISLTSIIGKLLESIIATKIRSHLETFNLIHSSQHGFTQGRSCLTNLLSFFSEVYEAVDNDKSYDIIYLDFSKAFDRVPHERLIRKVEAHGIGGSVLKWIRSWLTGRKQRVSINGLKSDWGAVKSGVPQGSVLGPLLFVIFINDLDLGITSRISKFADDTKMGRVINSDSDFEHLQRDLDTLHEWSVDWQMNFNTDKCKVLQIGKTNTNVKYKLGNTEIENSVCEKDLGVFVSNDLKPRKQCISVRNKANRILGFISRSVSNRTADVILKLYLALVRPHMDYAVQFWCPYYRMDIDSLERVQRRMTKMIHNIRNLPYEERLKSLGLHSLERRRVRGDMIEVYKWVSGINKGKMEDVLKLSNNEITRTNGFKLDKFRFRKDIGKHWFGNRVVDMWNRLPSAIVGSGTLGSFKTKLDRHMEVLGWV